MQNEWSQPQVQGDLVTPRAGHAGVVIGDDWFIVGGGDNCNGMKNIVEYNLAWHLFGVSLLLHYENV